MKNFFRNSLLLFLLIGGLLLLAGCSGDNSGSASTPSPETIKGLIQTDIDDVDAGVKDVESKASSATGDMAALLANNLYALKNRIDTVAGTFDNDIKDGFITETEREDFDKTIDDIKSTIDKDINDLKAKAGDAAGTISPDSKAVAVTSQEELDKMISDDDEVITNFQAGLKGATGTTLTTMKGVVEDKLASVEQAIDDIDRLVSSGVIPEDEKDTYLRDLKKVRRSFEEIDDSIASSESEEEG